MCFTQLVFSFQEFLKLIPGLVIFPFTIYLAAKKIGTSISFNIGWTLNHLGGHFTAVTLINQKDKPVIIKSLTLVYQNIQIELDRFDIPHILKPYEAIVINPKPYSYLVVDGKQWEIPFSAHREIELYVVVAGGIHKCKSLTKAPRIYSKFVGPKAYKRAEKHLFQQNGEVYNPHNIEFILVYGYKGKMLTTFVEKSGAIVDSTGLNIHFLNASQMRSVETVAAALKSSQPELILRVTEPPPN